MDFEKLYRETFSQVRASSSVNLEEFNHMKHKHTVKFTLLAAVIGLFLALCATAYATDFFGLRSVILSDEAGNPGLISMQGYVDSPEYMALYDYYYGGLSLEQAAEKYGLTVPDRCEVFGYDSMAELLGGDLTDARNSRWSFYIYEDGTFGGDQEYTCDDGQEISYQMYRSVKGSLTQVSLNSAALERDYEEWNIKLDGYDVCLVLGGGERSLIISDLGDCFLTINVLAGKVLDPTFGGPIDRDQLEALAKSLHLDVLSRVAVPDLPPEPDYSAGEEHFAADIDNDPMRFDVVVTTFNLVEGDREIGVEVIGREGPYNGRWGVRELRIYDYDKSGKWADDPFQTIAVTGAGQDFVNGVYAGYTECWSREDTVQALDMNFDGYADLAVFGWTPNNTIPYYYWFWNEGFGGFEYTITLQGAEPVPETRQVVECYKSGGAVGEYIYNYYAPDADGYLRLVDRKTEQYGDYVEANDYEGMLGYLQSQYNDPFYLRYGLFDLTGDGSAELIAGYGTCEADAVCGVWSMDSGRLRKIGTFGMGHAQLYIVDGALLRLTGHMGYEFISQIGFDGTQVTETTLSQRQLGPEDEYASFDTAFEMAPDSDLGLLRAQ